jgi:hypothetical protein
VARGASPRRTKIRYRGPLTIRITIVILMVCGTRLDTVNRRVRAF